MVRPRSAGPKASTARRRLKGRAPLERRSWRLPDRVRAFGSSCSVTAIGLVGLMFLAVLDDLPGDQACRWSWGRGCGQLSEALLALGKV